MELVINLELPKNRVDEMNVYRKKYHPMGLSHSHAHITVIPPFTLQGTLEDLTKVLRKLIRQRKPFEIVVDGLGSFGNKILFLKPNCPPELEELQSSLKILIGRKFRKDVDDAYWEFKDYRPHITIAKDKPTKIRQLKKELKGLQYKKNITITGVNLCVWQGETEGWVLEKKFLFR